MRHKPDKRAIIIDHVGNVYRHGLPDMDRQWSLDPKPQKTARKAAVPVRQCPDCYYTHSPAAVCPKCGHVYANERTVEAQGGELKKINEQRIADIIKTYDTYKKCKTLKELAVYGKLKGYKPGWAWYKGKEMGIIGRG
jgi:ribosomal protein L32